MGGCTSQFRNHIAQEAEAAVVVVEEHRLDNVADADDGNMGRKQQVVWVQLVPTANNVEEQHMNLSAGAACVVDVAAGAAWPGVGHVQKMEAQPIEGDQWHLPTNSRVGVEVVLAVVEEQLEQVQEKQAAEIVNGLAGSTGTVVGTRRLAHLLD